MTSDRDRLKLNVVAVVFNDPGESDPFDDLLKLPKHKVAELRMSGDEGMGRVPPVEILS